MTDLQDQRPLSRIELVVLGRLSPAKGATAKEIAKSLRELGVPLVDDALADRVTATLASLGARALVASSVKPKKTKKPPLESRFTQTQAGRIALCQAFGVDVTLAWKDIYSRIVPALALGEQPGSEAATAALASAEAMLATLLRRESALGEFTTVAQLCDRIIARGLGMPSGPVTPSGIRAYALAMHCGAGNKARLEGIAGRFAPAKAAKRAKPTPESELKSLAAELAKEQFNVGSETKATIVSSLQRRWVSQHDEADDAQRPSDLRSTPLQPRPPVTEGTLGSSSARCSPSPDAAEGLLYAVREAIPRVGSDGRYGKENVFVSALWRQVAGNRRLPALSLDGFKRWLVTANRNRLLALARADLVDDMDARLVEDSEIEDLGATFHFVLDRREPPSGPGQVHYGR